jgi:MFS family permease
MNEFARPPASALDAFKHRDFAIFWTAAMISNIGTWMQGLAVPYVIYESTGSVRWVGLASFLQLIPSVLTSPFGGAIADRYRRRRVLIVTQSGYAVLALALWLVWLAGWRNPWALVAPVALGGAIGGINMPSWQGFVYDLVPAHLLSPAVTMNSAQFHLSRSIGPIVAGVVLARFGPSWTFLVNASSFLVVIAAIVLVHPQPIAKTPVTGSVTQQMADAIRYVRARRDLQLPIIILGLIGFFGHPLNSLLVPIGKKLFGYGSGGVGVLTAGFGLGAGVGVLLMERVRRHRTNGRVIAVTLTGYAAAVVVFASSRNLPMATLLLMPLGCMHLICVSSMNVMLQQRTDEHMRGRVLSLYLSSFGVALPVGSLMLSALAAAIGLRTAVALSGSVLLAIVLLFRRNNLRADLDRDSTTTTAVTISPIPNDPDGPAIPLGS